MIPEGHDVDSKVAEHILRDLGVAYAITDDGFNVVQEIGSVDILWDRPESCLGRCLIDCVPELVGCEDLLADVLAGDLPRFELAWANRETADGRTLYLTIVLLPYRDRSGRNSGIVYVVQDVTDMGLVDRQLAQSRNELRLLQDQLTRQNLELAAANAELRRLDQMKSTFVSVAAHELRTPLAPIRGYIEVLLDEDVGHLNAEQREYLEILKRSVQRLLVLTHNLLDVTRIETGRVELVLRPADLPALIEAVVAEYSAQVEARAQLLELHLSPCLPPALCDEARAAQIVGNLLSNAVKYTPPGGRIDVTLAPAGESGFIEVSVADTGVGIPPEDHPKLFERFFRSSSAVLARATGAGLGLYITRSLVELHGGRIWFESEPGEGSVFHVTFPVAGPRAAPGPSSASSDP